MLLPPGECLTKPCVCYTSFVLFAGGNAHYVDILGRTDSDNSAELYKR